MMNLEVKTELRGIYFSRKIKKITFELFLVGFCPQEAVSLYGH